MRAPTTNRSISVICAGFLYVIFNEFLYVNLNGFLHMCFLSGFIYVVLGIFTSVLFQEYCVCHLLM